MPVQLLYGSGQGVPESNQQNQALLGQIGQGYDQLYQNQLQQYNQILAGYQQAIGQYAGFGASQQFNTGANFAQSGANLAQANLSRGLGNSTVAANQQIGNYGQQQQAQNTLSDTLQQGQLGLAQAKLGYQAAGSQYLGGVQQAKLNFLNTVNAAPAVDPTAQAQIALQDRLQAARLAQNQTLQTQQIGAQFGLQTQQGYLSGYQQQLAQQAQLQRQLQQQQAGAQGQVNSNLNAYKDVLGQLQGAQQQGAGLQQQLIAGPQGFGGYAEPGQFGSRDDLGEYPQGYGGTGIDIVNGAPNANITNFPGAYNPAFSPQFGPGIAGLATDAAGFIGGSAGGYGAGLGYAGGALTQPSVDTNFGYGSGGTGLLGGVAGAYANGAVFDFGSASGGGD